MSITQEEYNDGAEDETQLCAPNTGDDSDPDVMTTAQREEFEDDARFEMSRDAGGQS
jgi:hypothetical protein